MYANARAFVESQCKLPLWTHGHTINTSYSNHWRKAIPRSGPTGVHGRRAQGLSCQKCPFKFVVHYVFNAGAATAAYRHRWESVSPSQDAMAVMRGTEYAIHRYETMNGSCRRLTLRSTVLSGGHRLPAPAVLGVQRQTIPRSLLRMASLHRSHGPMQFDVQGQGSQLCGQTVASGQGWDAMPDGLAGHVRCWQVPGTYD